MRSKRSLRWSQDSVRNPYLSTGDSDGVSLQPAPNDYFESHFNHTLKFQPTRKSGLPLCLYVPSLAPLAARGAREREQEALSPALCRLSVNDPPTAVGGIQEPRSPAPETVWRTALSRFSVDAAPNAVGGIQEPVNHSEIC